MRSCQMLRRTMVVILTWNDNAVAADDLCFNPSCLLRPNTKKTTGNLVKEVICSVVGDTDHGARRSDPLQLFQLFDFSSSTHRGPSCKKTCLSLQMIAIVPLRSRQTCAVYYAIMHSPIHTSRSLTSATVRRECHRGEMRRVDLTQGISSS